MNLLAFTQATLLLAVSVTGAPSFYNLIQFHSKPFELYESIKFPLTTTRNQNYSDEEADIALAGFVERAMFNYSTWLAQEDPLQPDPSEVTLVTDGFDFEGINAVMKIRNQDLANHSFTGREHLVLSTFSKHMLYTYTGLRFGPNIEFGGDYIVNGTFNVSDTLELPFSGQGRYILKGNDFVEAMAHHNYTINEDGYVDLANSSKIYYGYIIEKPKWNKVVFEQLTFNYEGDIDATWTLKLEENLTKMYDNLLLDQYPDFEWNNLLKRLLHTYLSQQLLTKKLDDIVAEWFPPTQ